MKTPIKRIEPAEADHAFRNEMMAVLDKHAGHLPSDRMLALAAYTVGQLVALQDQTEMTPDMALDIVQANMEAGNQHVMADLMNKTEGSA